MRAREARRTLHQDTFVKVDVMSTGAIAGAGAGAAAAAVAEPPPPPPKETDPASTAPAEQPPEQDPAALATDQEIREAKEADAMAKAAPLAAEAFPPASRTSVIHDANSAAKKE